jgi:hypothetical protein
LAQAQFTKHWSMFTVLSPSAISLNYELIIFIIIWHVCYLFHIILIFFSFNFYVNYDHSYLHPLNSRWKGFWVSYLIWFSRKSTFICGHSFIWMETIMRPPVFFLYCRFTLVMYYLFIYSFNMYLPPRNFFCHLISHSLLNICQFSYVCVHVKKC